MLLAVIGGGATLTVHGAAIARGAGGVIGAAGRHGFTAIGDAADFIGPLTIVIIDAGFSFRLSAESIGRTSQTVGTIAVVITGL